MINIKVFKKNADKVYMVTVLIPKPGEWSTLDDVQEHKLSQMASVLVNSLNESNSFEMQLKLFIQFRKDVKQLNIMDTSPRENVLSFVYEISEQLNISSGTIRDIWNKI